MRRIARIDRSIGLLQTRTIAFPPSPYICSACQSQTSSFSSSSLRAARGNIKTSFTDRLRQRIWGADQPPGLDDPYGEGSVFDQTKKQAKETKVNEVEGQRNVPLEAPLDPTYEPAITWDGLDEVGDKERWEPDHPYKGFLPAERATNSEAITAALHRAMVEVFALQQAGKSLSDISQAEPRDDFTDYVQIIPSATGATLEFSDNASLGQIVQSLAPAVDETSPKINPTESEEDVAADRSNIDPLHPDSIPPKVDEPAEKRLPTESEEDVAADRSTVDPLQEGAVQQVSYAENIASWDPSWLQVSIENPEVKFAVSIMTSLLLTIY